MTVGAFVQEGTVATERALLGLVRCTALAVLITLRRVHKELTARASALFNSPFAAFPPRRGETGLVRCDDLVRGPRATRQPSDQVVRRHSGVRIRNPQAQQQAQ